MQFYFIAVMIACDKIILDIKSSKSPSQADIQVKFVDL